MDFRSLLCLLQLNCLETKDIARQLKGQGHVTVNKPVISRINVVAHTWPFVFCTDFCGWGESTVKLLIEIHQHLCNRTTYEYLVCYSTKYKSPSSKYHFHFEKSSGKSL